MVIDTDEKGITRLKEIYGDTVLETEEGNQLAVCMRDDTIEMSVVGSNRWFRANMETGEIEKEKRKRDDDGFIIYNSENG